MSDRLYMVVETFRDANAAAIRERFLAEGRMMPDGLEYVASWIEPDGERCFQIMRTADPKLFDAWTANWDDLMEFEITEIYEALEFWKIFDASATVESSAPSD